MKVSGVNHTEYYEQISTGRKKQENGTFERELAGNLSESALQQKSETKTTDSRKDGIISYPGIPSGINVYHVMECDRVTKCNAKNLSYEESDYVKICIEDGCVYKAKVYEKERMIYVEKKSEDGMVEGFKVSVEQVAEKRDNIIEEIAQQTYEKYGLEENKNVEETDFKAALLKFYEYVEERIENGPHKFAIGNAEMSLEEWNQLIEKVDEELDEIKEEQRERIEKQKKAAPYSHLADENGTIMYNGVCFVCDNDNQALCLGDMSNQANVITIPLSGGGCLMVNRDSIGALSKAMGMFSPEDQGRIMRAIAQDVQCRRKQKEIEETEEETLSEINS